MRRLPLAALALTCGCATTLTASPTTPTLDVTRRGLPSLPSRSVLVLSAASFLEVAPDLPFNACLSSSGPGSRASAVNCPPARVGELSAVTAQVERTLFEAGWEPLTQAAKAKLITSPRVAIGLRELLSRGEAQASLLEASLQVALASSADLLVVVSDWWAAYAPRPAAEAPRAKLCPAGGVLGMEAYGRAGTLLWRGQVVVRATDTVPVSMTGSQVSPPGYACAARDSCAECTAAPEGGVVPLLLTQATTALVNEMLARQGLKGPASP